MIFALTKNEKRMLVMVVFLLVLGLFSTILLDTLTTPKTSAIEAPKE
jgi:membrane-bound metal-dependent hydrolase YbcI (DUF457 family)